MKNINKIVNGVFRQLDMFLDSDIKPKGGRRFYCTSLSNLVYWGLIYGVRKVKFKSCLKSEKMKVFVVFEDGSKWHSRYCTYKSFTAIWYLSIILQKISYHNYNELTKYIELMEKKLKRGKIV